MISGSITTLAVGIVLWKLGRDRKRRKQVAALASAIKHAEVVGLGTMRASRDSPRLGEAWSPRVSQ